MDEMYTLQVLSMFFLSLWKTYIGPVIAATGGFGYAEMLLFNMIPACLSAGGTLYATDYWIKKRSSKPKGFNKHLRNILRFWKRYGKHLSLLLSPVLLGVPSYALIARRLKTRRSVILLELNVIVFVWCSVLFFAARESLALAEWVLAT